MRHLLFIGYSARNIKQSLTISILELRKGMFITAFVTFLGYIITLVT